MPDWDYFAWLRNQGVKFWKTRDKGNKRKLEKEVIQCITGESREGKLVEKGVGRTVVNSTLSLIPKWFLFECYGSSIFTIGLSGSESFRCAQPSFVYFGVCLITNQAKYLSCFKSQTDILPFYCRMKECVSTRSSVFALCCSRWEITLCVLCHLHQQKGKNRKNWWWL